MVFIQFLYSGVRAEFKKCTVDLKGNQNRMQNLWRSKCLIYSGSHAKGLFFLLEPAAGSFCWGGRFADSSELRPQLDLPSSRGASSFYTQILEPITWKCMFQTTQEKMEVTVSAHGRLQPVIYILHRRRGPKPLNSTQTPTHYVSSLEVCSCISLS